MQVLCCLMNEKHRAESNASIVLFNAKEQCAESDLYKSRVFFNEQTNTVRAKYKSFAV